MNELKEFNKKYLYMTDQERFNTSLDIWELPEEVNGIIIGDCESYCRYLKNNIPYFQDWEYYYCKINGNGHCVLVQGSYIIDCNFKNIVLKERYFEAYTVTEFKKYNWFTIVSKIMFAKVYIWVSRN